MPSFDKEGHIVLDLSVGRYVGRNVGMPVSLHMVQLITQEGFAPEASNLVGREYLMSKSSLLIFRSVGQRSCWSPIPCATDKSREKGRDLTQSYDKSPYTNRNVKRAK